jgi:ketosteroid isomerase-like protein
MAGHPNEDLLRKGYEAFGKYDLETIQALFADDVVFHIPGKNPVSGDYKGKDEVFGFFAKMLTLSDGTFKTEAHDVLANDTHGIVLAHNTAQREGKVPLDINETAIYHIDDGKVVEAWFFNASDYTDDEFWS